jgi:hypothetical protein
MIGAELAPAAAQLSHQIEPLRSAAKDTQARYGTKNQAARTSTLLKRAILGRLGPPPASDHRRSGVRSEWRPYGKRPGHFANRKYKRPFGVEGEVPNGHR